jgi:hypothetical protein
MTAVLTRSTHREQHTHGDKWRPRAARDAGPTLDDVVSRAWEVLRVELPAACPVCGGDLIPRASAGAGVVGGRCRSCGSTLS